MTLLLITGFLSITFLLSIIVANTSIKDAEKMDAQKWFSIVLQWWLLAIGFSLILAFIINNFLIEQLFN